MQAVASSIILKCNDSNKNSWFSSQCFWTSSQITGLQKYPQNMILETEEKTRNLLSEAGNVELENSSLQLSGVILFSYKKD